MLPYEELVIVLEVAECAEMDIYEYGHHLAFLHTARALAVVLAAVIAADFQVWMQMYKNKVGEKKAFGSFSLTFSIFHTDGHEFF